MVESEIMVLIVSAVVALVGGGRVLLTLVRPADLGRGRGARHVVLVGLIGGLALIGFVLTHYAADDVRGDAKYVTMYFVLGAAWLTLAANLAGFLGVSIRDDAVERRNPAAAAAVAGGLVGAAACYAGGNIGNGPGWWVVVLAGGAATIGLLAAWWLVNLGSAAAERITVERDLATGLRVGGLLAACGLILGRAVAGDWISTPALLTDLGRVGWPAAGGVVIELLLARATSPTPARPAAPAAAAGLVPGVVYVSAAVLYVATRGPW